MSVQIADFKVFQYVQTGFINAANNNACDNLYSQTIKGHCRHKDFIEESTRWISNLLYLTSKTYAANYNEELDDLRPFYSHSFHTLDSLQLIKYIMCLQYNICLDTICHKRTPFEDLNLITDQDRQDVKRLDDFRIDITHQYITNLDHWKTCKWSN